MDCTLPGSSVHGISQTRILKWVAISFFRGSSQTRDRTQVSWIAGGLLHCRWVLYWLSHQGSINNPMHVVIRDKVARVFLCVHICILLSIDILQGFVQLLLKGMIKITKQFTKPYWGAVKSWHFWTGLSSSQLSVEIIEDSTCCYTPYFPRHKLSQILKSSCSTYLLLLQ